MFSFPGSRSGVGAGGDGSLPLFDEGVGLEVMGATGVDGVDEDGRLGGG